MTRTAPEARAELNIDALQIRFGPPWTWTQIAEWTLARAADCPRFQVQWARDFLERRRQQEQMLETHEEAFGPNGDATTPGFWLKDAPQL